MNPRIRELINEAYVFTTPNDPLEFSREKFAELIIKECLKYTDDSFGDIDYVKFMIKRNFGVEQ